MNTDPAGVLDRSVLPLAEPIPPQVVGVDARTTPFVSSTSRPSAPYGAPNVVLVVLDDLGFGAPSAFGGPISMPTADRLSQNGLRYTRFHVAAMCSPTRAALLTGRNHHAVGTGCTADMATSAPGYTASRPKSAATLARVLGANGYSTGAFGKMHQTPQHEVSVVGPFDRWPIGDGFEKFYGFVGGEMDHWTPQLFDGTVPVEPTTDGDTTYHLSEDLVDRGLDWVRYQKALAPDKPFFMYLPLAACHAPLHVAPEWSEKYRGKFAHGWSRQRDLTLPKQNRLGVVLEDVELAPWVEGVPHWDELSSVQRRVAERFMETFAGFTEHADAQVGRLLDGLQELDQLDNTIILYLLGDNGGSAEGGLEGTLNAQRAYSGINDTSEFIDEHLAELGGPGTFPLHPVGWTLAMNTPYAWAKQVASHYGGTRDGLIVHWPAGIKDRGGLRHQFHHVVDVMPTILDAIGLPAPREVDGVVQQRMDGISMVYSFNDADAPDRRTTQYFEMLGNRGIYHEGWMACAKHRTPWQQTTVQLPKFEDDTWELYDLSRDWTQARNVADQHPKRLSYLKDVFFMEATRNNVFPLDDRMAERYDPALAGRPDLLAGRTSMTLHGGMIRLSEDAVPNIKNRSHSITASIVVGEFPGSGVVISQGGRFAGWTLYLDNGMPVYSYNYFQLKKWTVTGDFTLAAGTHEIRLDFTYDGGGIGRGGLATLSVDGEKVASGRVEHTCPFAFSFHETLNVGVDLGTPVIEYPFADTKFSGEVNRVVIDVSGGNEQGEAEGLAKHKLAFQ